MKLLRCYPQVWVLSYFLLYLPWFFLLEARDLKDCTIIRFPLDDLIPFCEYFIVPYLLWFFYMATAIAYFLFTLPKQNFYQISALLFGGMTVCLVLYTFFYTGLDLRPEIDPNKNVFTYLISLLWKADTSTNVCPSIHTFATLAVQAGFTHIRFYKKHPILYRCSTVLAVSIVLSTVFLKQHSVLDVACAAGLLHLMHHLIYGSAPVYLRRRDVMARA